MFSPPYSLSLVSMGSGNMVKRLNTSQLQILKKSPVPVSTNTLSDTHATLLRKFLNENATDGVPGWISTAIGIAAPVAWVGIGADALSQAVNGSGDAGRLQVANLAGTVTQGGKVGVLEQVADDRSGRPKFMASYVYTAQINNSQVTTLLAICSADVVEDGPAPYRVSTSKTDADNTTDQCDQHGLQALSADHSVHPLGNDDRQFAIIRNQHIHPRQLQTWRVERFRD